MATLKSSVLRELEKELRDYWLSPKEDDVRPYGVLFREVGH